MFFTLGEADITKNDLDEIEDQYGSSSSGSMSLKKFTQKMNEKNKDFEKEQEQMNLHFLLASDSEEGILKFLQDSLSIFCIYIRRYPLAVFS